MIDLLVSITLVVIMIGIGMSLTFNDFKNVFVYPKSIITGIGSQALLLPATSFLLAWLAPLNVYEKLGIVLIALCPVGTTSNILVHIFKGNTALSISMTIVNSLLSPLTIPFFITVAASIFINQQTQGAVDISFVNSVIDIIVMVIIPATIGLMIRQYAPKIAEKCEKPLKFILPAMLLVVFSLKIFVGGNGNQCTPLTLNETLIITPFVLALNVIGMYGGFFIAKIFKLNKPSQITVATETGLQNTALALAVAATLPNGCLIEKPILVYAMFTFFTAVVFLLIHSDVKIKDFMGKE